jgi:hypothetical protein
LLISDKLEHLDQEGQRELVETEDYVGEISDRPEVDAARIAANRLSTSGDAADVGEISDVPVPMEDGHAHGQEVQGC